MSFDPTLELTVRDEIHDIIVNILMYVNVNIPVGLEKDLVDYIYRVNSDGDRPEYVPTEWEVLILIVTRLLEIGRFTTDEDLNKMADYYKNEWRA